MASYGEHYSILKGKNNPINKEKYKKYPLLKSHSKNGFEEPIKYYVPSVAISQIIKIGDVKKNVFLVTSLKAKTIFIIELDENFKLISEKKFYIGDLAASYEIIQSRAKKNNFFKEFDKVWIHGLLHLIGYDHIKNIDYYKMLKIEKRILNLI